MTRAFLLTLALAAAAVLAVGLGRPPANDAAEERTQVVVGLAAPPLALGRANGAAGRIDAEQGRFEAALHAAIPAASVRWRYRLVANGMSVVLPRADVRLLAGLPGVRHVYGNVTYRTAAGPDATTIRAAGLRSTTLANGGAGIKIGIIDDGVDQTHTFFDPAGLTMPAGFPKGQQAFTTAKVIVARAFPPLRRDLASRRKAVRPGPSRATGRTSRASRQATRTSWPRAQRVSGIAPRALIGNYKALTIPTDANVGLDGNAPEIVAAIEAAVADGMDVINLSIGEPEVEPSRDLVALALDAAAAAGVVPVVAAGNDFGDYGLGSLASPGTSADSITVGATSSGAAPVIAGFSSAGPTPVSLRLKPDVVAPGQSILSATPDGWRTSSGTSMAAPHVAGAVALLLERHPEWTPAQVKAALTATARPLAVGEPDAGRRGARRRRCGGRAAPPGDADRGLLRPRATLARRSSVALRSRTPAAAPERGRSPSSPAPRPRERRSSLRHRSSSRERSSCNSSTGTTQGELSGTLVLSGAERVRRIPFWARVSVPRLAASTARPLARPGIYAGNTRGRSARVDVLPVPGGGAGRPGERPARRARAGVRRPARRGRSRTSASSSSREGRARGSSHASSPPATRTG